MTGWEALKNKGWKENQERDEAPFSAFLSATVAQQLAPHRSLWSSPLPGGKTTRNLYVVVDFAQWISNGSYSYFQASKLFEVMTLMFSTYAYLSHVRRNGAAATTPAASTQHVSGQFRRSYLSGTFHLRATAFLVLAVGILLALSV